MRSFWFPRRYRILREGQILHANPRRQATQVGQKAQNGLVGARGQPPLTCWTPEIVPWAVCSAEPTDEVPVIAAWIAVQMACDTFG
jgi:hypothetical protein